MKIPALAWNRNPSSSLYLIRLNRTVIRGQKFYMFHIRALRNINTY